MKRTKYSAFVRWLSMASAVLLSGCKAGVLDPKGPIGHDERTLIITAVLLMLVVVIPVIVMTIAFAWKYRASNKKAEYRPNWSHSNKIEVVVWTVPCIIILILGTITWKTTHSLDPFKPLETADNQKPITIEVVALDWKWLFIYPEQHIATVNQVTFPENVPVRFKVTSDTVMNSFFIPQLGSQIYAMAGMQTEVNLLAHETGTFDGMSAHFSGDGFAHMNFKAIATSQSQFNEWVNKVKQAQDPLDQASYDALAKPSEQNPVAYYSSVKPDLFKSIVASYMNSNSDTASVEMQSDSGVTDVR
ncbi:ubiquinol oxidase subunit II [Methylophaga sulfidovorans]|uniref:Ubiquinol oxidase subunit 2 n=1 Tax=Methylophaga sulfidovorans TaxID=45496 RepID=A0A1I4BJA5_9GAMM|nr:ubiquinol oxidase subunit II [Methylophaga sulfidovorans]SFK68914.1 cytochrome bo3 quinol oxidase subunit 2 [Methylophaga sulfidovorans]